eukprot:jgi/Orpsp1_1/1177970/evm.model.c7180000063579.1
MMVCLKRLSLSFSEPRMLHHMILSEICQTIPLSIPSMLVDLFSTTPLGIL